MYSVKNCKAVGEAGVDLITDLVIQIIVGTIPAEWELRNSKL